MKRIYTIGHSTRTVEEFIDVLKRYGIQLLVDVRSLPGSNHMPQYNREELGPSLEKEGIAYTYLGLLGGLRKTRKDSPNQGWKNASFRGYADYMQTPEFKEGMEELTALASDRTAAIMCAEAVPWRCHRSMVGDALLVRGWEVLDIFDAKTVKEEKLTSFAKVDGIDITYPPYEEHPTLLD